MKMIPRETDETLMWFYNTLLFINWRVVWELGREDEPGRFYFVAF